MIALLVLWLVLLGAPSLAYWLGRRFARREDYRYGVVQDCTRLTHLIAAGRTAGTPVMYFVLRRSWLMRQRDEWV